MDGNIKIPEIRQIDEKIPVRKKFWTPSLKIPIMRVILCLLILCFIVFIKFNNRNIFDEFCWRYKTIALYETFSLDDVKNTVITGVNFAYEKVSYITALIKNRF